MVETQPSRALFADLYELTMAQAYLQGGVTAQATFSLTFRSYPPDRGYFVLGGMPDVLDYLESLRFRDQDLEYLRSLELFDDDFLRFLAGTRFTGEVRAMKEGAIFFAGEPVVEVTAPIIEAQLAETFLLNQVSLQTMLATKCLRVVQAARGRTLVDFAARRTQGTDAAIKLARVSYMAGFSGTSNVLGGGLYGVPVFGTMAHSFVEAFPTEIDAFRSYASSFPNTSTFLVDTYDTREGMERAIEVANEMRRHGSALHGVRLDSGDLLELSGMARALLDEAGLRDVEVFASGGLDEFEVDRLLSAGAPIDGFGVGTLVGVSADAPWSDCAYKLVEYDGRPTLKMSSGKRSQPGAKQVYRYRVTGGDYVRDIISLAAEGPPEGDAEPLLHGVMRDGKRLEGPEPLGEVRERLAEDFRRLPATSKTLRSPARYDLSVSPGLARLTKATEAQVGRREPAT